MVDNVQTVNICVCCQGLTYSSLGQISVPGWAGKNISDVKQFTGPVNGCQDLLDDTQNSPEKP
jgi:hypothetical protein